MGKLDRKLHVEIYYENIKHAIKLLNSLKKKELALYEVGKITFSKKLIRVEIGEQEYPSRPSWGSTWFNVALEDAIAISDSFKTAHLHLIDARYCK